MVAPDALNELRNTLRKGQQTMADWQGGELAVSAVPGAGKSTGMAVATAIAIAKFQLHRQKQLVIVTFTRSAVSNIRKKVSAHLKTSIYPKVLSPSALCIAWLIRSLAPIANCQALG